MRKFRTGNAKVGAVLAGALLLGACGSKEESGTGEDAVLSGRDAPSLEEMKRAAAGLVRPEPGEYTRTITVEEFDVPGLPADMQQQFKGMMAKDRTDSFCLTEKEAEDGFRDMFDNMQETSNCQYEKFEVSGGTLDARMTCSPEGQGKAVMTLKGTAKATSSDVRMTMKMTGGQPPVSEMNMTMHMVSTRTGECSS